MHWTDYVSINNNELICYSTYIFLYIMLQLIQKSRISEFLIDVRARVAVVGVRYIHFQLCDLHKYEWRQAKDALVCIP